MFRRLAAVAVVIGLVLVPVSSAAAVEPAQASSGPVAMDTIDGFNPSPTKWREFMISITSRVLGGATPNKWQAENLANQYRANFQAEKILAKNGINVLNPGYITHPDSYNENVLRGIEEATTDARVKPGTSDTVKTKKFKVPATKAKKFVKGAGAAAVGMTLYGMAAGLTSGGVDMVSGWFGVDSASEFCSWSTQNGFLGGAWEVASGRDCSMFGFDEGYEPNSDAEGGFSDLVTSGLSISYLGTHSTGQHVYFCYSASGSTSLIQPMFWRMQDVRSGSGVQYFSAFNALASGACAAYPTATNALFSVAWGSTVALSPVVMLVNRGTVGDPESDDVVAGMGETVSDPERVLECIITMTDGSTVRSVSEPYRESDGRISPPICPGVPDGKVAESVSVGEVGGATLYEEATTDEYQDWAERFPNCVEGLCTLDLFIKSGTVLGKSCFDLVDGCPDWWEDPQRADKYQCTYGGEHVDVEECAVYAGLFQPGRTQVGAPYSDPMTGEWSGGQNSPALDGQAMGQAIQNPASTRTCTGMNVTGFDPVGFVMRPIQCALEWAFVPRPLVIEVELAGGEVAWENKPPAVIAGMVGSFAPAMPVSGCSRTVTIFSGQFATEVTPLDACPGSFLAPVASISRVVTTLGMVVLVIVVLRRQVSGMIGYGAGQ